MDSICSRHETYYIFFLKVSLMLVGGLIGPLLGVHILGAAIPWSNWKVSSMCLTVYLTGQADQRDHHHLFVQ